MDEEQLLLHKEMHLDSPAGVLEAARMYDRFRARELQHFDGHFFEIRSWIPVDAGHILVCHHQPSQDRYNVFVRTPFRIVKVSWDEGDVHLRAG